MSMSANIVALQCEYNNLTVYANQLCNNICNLQASYRCSCNGVSAKQLLVQINKMQRELSRVQRRLATIQMRVNNIQMSYNYGGRRGYGRRYY